MLLSFKFRSIDEALGPIDEAAVIRRQEHGGLADMRKQPAQIVTNKRSPVAGRIRYRTCLFDSAWRVRYAKKLLISGGHHT